jgi:adenylate kinase
MSNRIIAIGGVPATGKTTLMRKVIKTLLPLKTFKYGLLRGLYNIDKKVYIMGIYDKSLFSGTDKLSMAVQPDFVKFAKKFSQYNIIFEGDRLFNQSLFDKLNCEIIVIKAKPETIENRHKLRNDTQTEKFKKAKQTKINNIIQNNSVIEFENNNEHDTKIIMNKTEHIKKKALIQALEKSLGVVTSACKKVGVGRTTYYDWYNNDEEFKKQVDELQNVALDFAESQLHNQIQKNNTAATIFFLKTKGKGRGYTEKSEVDITSGGKSISEIKIEVIDTNKD